MQDAAAGIGEPATPTGAALLRTLAEAHGAQPPMIVEALGVGEGG
ncbi:UNVERIFIED_CONTAM: pyridinium-3,5-bisthiocarboxylic acid mononucleotide nickel chelatase, partial [Kocuria sp. CPCC 205295]